MFTVDIELNGKTETLKTSLRAARAVSGVFGNYLDALDQLAKFNPGAYTVVIAAGLEKKPAEVEEAVFTNGLPNLSEPLALFVNSLAHGGRDPNAKVEGGTTSGKQ